MLHALKIQSLLALIPNWEDRYAEYDYAAEIKFLKIVMKSDKNLQRSKHGLKTSTRFYLEERENIF